MTKFTPNLGNKKTELSKFKTRSNVLFSQIFRKTNPCETNSRKLIHVTLIHAKPNHVNQFIQNL